VYKKLETINKIMKQPIRKNKTKQVVNMPTTSYYTLEDLFALNTHFTAEITVRVRHTKMIESGKVVKIGVCCGEHGRPKKVYAYAPVTKLVLDKAYANNIIPDDNMTKLVPLVNVTSPSANIPFVPRTMLPLTK